MPSREKTQEDFDLERFIDMFDEALTSDDERVINALRSLMMMVVLTKPETRKDARIGPLRQLFDDMHNLNRRMRDMEDRLHHADRAAYSAKDYWEQSKSKYSLATAMSDEDYRKALISVSSQLNSPKGK